MIVVLFTLQLMVVGVPGPVGRHVIVQQPEDCHKGNGHVLARPRFLLGVAALVTQLINDHVPVKNNFKLSIIARKYV